MAGDWTEDSLKQFLNSNVLAAAIAQLILSFVILCTMGAGLLVLKDVREVNKEIELANASHKQAYQHKRGGRKKEWERTHSAGTCPCSRTGRPAAHEHENHNIRIYVFRRVVCAVSTTYDIGIQHTNTTCVCVWLVGCPLPVRIAASLQCVCVC